MKEKNLKSEMKLGTLSDREIIDEAKKLLPSIEPENIGQEHEVMLEETPEVINPIEHRIAFQVREKGKNLYWHPIKLNGKEWLE